MLPGIGFQLVPHFLVPRVRIRLCGIRDIAGLEDFFQPNHNKQLFDGAGGCESGLKINKKKYSFIVYFPFNLEKIREFPFFCMWYFKNVRF